MNGVYHELLWSQGLHFRFAPVRALKCRHGSLCSGECQLCWIVWDGLMETDWIYGKCCLYCLIKWIKNALILVAFQLRVLYQGKYYSAGITQMNKASRFNLEAVSDHKTAFHWCIQLWWPVLSARCAGSHWMQFTFCIRVPEQDLMKMCTCSKTKK